MKLQRLALAAALAGTAVAGHAACLSDADVVALALGGKKR